MFTRRLITGPSFNLIRNCTRESAFSGDDGKSAKLTGEILNKDDRIFYAIGATEELLSYIGLTKEYAVEAQHEYIHKLTRIQTVLIDINTAISKYDSMSRQKIPKKHTKELEEWNSKYSKELPAPELYIIPGGGICSASLHVARSLCRRTERVLVPLVREGGLDKEAQVYMNRLADFLFTLSRIASKLDKRTESIYQPQPGETLQAQ